MTLKIFYRISDKGNKRGKPHFFTIQNCLNNFLTHFPITTNDITVIADNIEVKTYEWLKSIFDENNIHQSKTGNSEGVLYTLNKAFELCDENDYVYFVEDDYLHKEKSKIILLEGIRKFDYVTLYDHKDKYMNPSPNKYVKDGGESTKVFLTQSCHWKLTNSTTMTFASSIKILKDDMNEFEKFCKGKKIPDDYNLFLKLTMEKNRRLASSIPGYSCHGATQFLTPLTNWSTVVNG